jgi:hypothetical protein
LCYLLGRRFVEKQGVVLGHRAGGRRDGFGAVVGQRHGDDPPLIQTH